MDKMWDLQEKEGLDIEIRQEMAARCGKEIKKLIKFYTTLHTFELW